MPSAMILFMDWMMIREERQLTEKYFFDTDCLSVFHWDRGESVLARCLKAGGLSRHRAFGRRGIVSRHMPGYNFMTVPYDERIGI